MHTHCIIGSGPAGVACASALLARGAKVLMLDAGIKLEPERARIVGDLAQKKSRKEWQPSQVAAVHGDADADLKGLPVKKLFGSDFPYRETGEKIPWRSQDVAVCPSLGFGGLSNVWGAAMLPLRDDDISDWPIKNSDLEEHYRAVAEMTGLAGRHDGLEEILPLYATNPRSLKLSRQAESFLTGLERHRDALRARGWHFGQSRLGVRAADSPRGAGCVYCGYCMTGCVYGCIFNAADTVRELQKQDNFQYQGDVIVTRLREESSKVLIEGFHRQTGAPLSFEAERVYLAAGVIPTAQIVLRSQDAFERPLTLRDSQYFLFPLIRARGVRGVQAEELYTLSQAFLELCHPRISRHSVHLQIYTYSDTIAGAVRRSLGTLKMFARPILERLLIAQGYLHSDESAGIQMTLKRDGAKDFLQLEPLFNPQTVGAVRKVLSELQGQRRALGGFVIPSMLQVAQPGRGFHCGGSLPMRAQPDDFETDCVGRPRGWSRIHVVDASVLPTVPATTITFSVMANAHRIGWESASAG
ncbi:MAG TPA: GMC oxidoreductase [Verrucomicrobiae bacterium]|jgi:choline dehydrogenase-like flavoprotein|nr:GMC oxidoreductase [Verrucomicrobiae bacterium]